MKLTKRILAGLLCMCMLWVAGLTMFSAYAEEGATGPIKGIALDKNKLSLNYGDTYQFKTTSSPEKPVAYSLSWSSSDKTLAKVDSTGFVTIAKATEDTDDTAKKVTITVSVVGKPSITDSCTITVSKKFDFGKWFGSMFNTFVTLFTTLFLRFKDPASDASKSLLDMIKKLFGSAGSTTA